MITRTQSTASAFEILFLLVSLLAPVRAQETAVWRDPSPHSVQFVPVEKDVRLEVLDWGGSGRPLVLLTGLGNTAHVYDDFAPKLTPEYHVYGITRRGYGASSAPVPEHSDYSADRLGDDVLAVIDGLKLARPVLAGHSIAGSELSSVGSRHPEKVAGLIYLDAANSYAFAFGPIFGREPAPPGVAEPPPPDPTAADRRSFAAFRSWLARTRGVALPESELHQTLASTPNGHVGKVRVQSSVVRAIKAGEQMYTQLTVPILAIYPVPHNAPPIIKDPAARAAFEAHDQYMMEALAKGFEQALPAARVVRLSHADHALFLSNEADVLREMRAFLSSLPSGDLK